MPSACIGGEGVSFCLCFCSVCMVSGHLFFVWPILQLFYVLIVLLLVVCIYSVLSFACFDASPSAALSRLAVLVTRIWGENTKLETM